MNSCTGSCLCGAVAYQIEGPYLMFQYCHCSRCRKFTGSAHGSNLFVESGKFRWLKGEERVGRYEMPEAKYFASCFCRDCGSSLPWRPKNSDKAVVVPAGTLDQDPGIKPERNIFWASRAPWRVECAAIECCDELPGKKG